MCFPHNLYERATNVCVSRDTVISQKQIIWVERDRVLALMMVIITGSFSLCVVMSCDYFLHECTTFHVPCFQMCQGELLQPALLVQKATMIRKTGKWMGGQFVFQEEKKILHPSCCSVWLNFQLLQNKWVKGSLYKGRETSTSLDFSKDTRVLYILYSVCVSSK